VIYIYLVIIGVSTSVVLLPSGPHSDWIKCKSVPFSKRGVAKEGLRVYTVAFLLNWALLLADLKIDEILLVEFVSQLGLSNK
jgi:hypothetical protein